MDEEGSLRAARERLGPIYRDLDDLWAARRSGPHDDAYYALGNALNALDDAEGYLTAALRWLEQRARAVAE